jgi:hypothetical protein
MVAGSGSAAGTDVLTAIAGGTGRLAAAGDDGNGGPAAFDPGPFPAELIAVAVVAVAVAEAAAPGWNASPEGTRSGAVDGAARPGGCPAAAGSCASGAAPALASRGGADGARE